MQAGSRSRSAPFLRRRRAHRLHAVIRSGRQHARWLRLPGLLAVATMALVGCSGAAASKEHVSVSTLTLKPGDCLVPPTKVTVQLATVERVPCGDPHTQEVYALPVYDTPTGTSNSSYPTDTVLKQFAEGNCAQQFQTWDGVAYPDSKLFFTYLLPSARSWSEDDRKIVCIIQTTGAPLRATTRNSKA